MSAPNLVAFAGPSVPPYERLARPLFTWHPPAAAGDLMRLLDRPPKAVCLIDGYFDAHPSVWHKEVLLLMAAGSAVLGAASMGALRAAELDRHGMIGVGAIYRAYRDVRILGDDEVALIHAGEDWGWKPLSEPLVEVRATLAAAARAGIVSVSAARTLRDHARSMHFSERSWPAMLSGAAIDPTAAESLATWLPGNVIRLKQADALACLDAALEIRKSPAPPHVPVTCFVTAMARQIGVSLDDSA